MNINMNDLASVIAKNNAGEQQAIADYLAMIAMPGLPHELIADIQEIISDEMHHGEVLSRWTTKLSGVKPALT